MPLHIITPSVPRVMIHFLDRTGSQEDITAPVPAWELVAQSLSEYPDRNIRITTVLDEHVIFTPAIGCGVVYVATERGEFMIPSDCEIVGYEIQRMLKPDYDGSFTITVTRQCQH